MMKKEFNLLHLAPTLLFAVVVNAVASLPALAAGSSGEFFIQRASTGSFAQTVDSLKHAVSSNGMMVMGQLDQKKALSMTGLNLAGAETFFVGNPVVGKKLFGMSPAVGAVLPVRIYVWEADGEAHVGYFQPSALLSSVDPKAGMAGKMLDGQFARILGDTIH